MTLVKQLWHTDRRSLRRRRSLERGLGGQSAPCRGRSPRQSSSYDVGVGSGSRCVGSNWAGARQLCTSMLEGAPKRFFCLEAGAGDASLASPDAWERLGVALAPTVDDRPFVCAVVGVGLAVQEATPAFTTRIAQELNTWCSAALDDAPDQARLLARLAAAGHSTRR
ncbi:hypothetical protein HC891_10450 [Candidatus Gracilibacteria bacterium]|nr:hypothetical protein [Candidatus Gracilibacteria bacterium]